EDVEDEYDHVTDAFLAAIGGTVQAEAGKLNKQALRNIAWWATSSTFEDERAGAQNLIVGHIADHRDVRRGQPSRRYQRTRFASRRVYLVQWLVYPPLSNMWEPRSALLRDISNVVNAHDAAVVARTMQDAVMETADDGASSVRVAVRIRPLIGREKVERCDECVSEVEAEAQVVMGKNRSFTYDYVFGKYAQQSDIWRCVEPLEYGIIPRVIMHMFETIEGKAAENPLFRAEVRIRFLEIYGEEIRDLLVTLGDATGESKVALRETESGEVLVTGAAEEPVQDADECLRLLERGTLCRTTGSTLMNAHSSRSHAIFTVSMGSALALELRRQVQLLQAEVHRLRNPGLSDSELKFASVGTNLIGLQADFDSYASLRSRAENAESEVARLTAELKRGKTQLDLLKEEMIAAQAERDYLRLCLEESSGAALSPAEQESKAGILQANLRTIFELQEKLRAVERERDRAVLTFDDSGLLSEPDAGSASAFEPFALPSFIASGLKEGTELIEKAEKDIERESAKLKKLKAEESGDDAGMLSEDGEAETESAEDSLGVEASEEEADRQRVFQRRQQHLGESVQDLAHDISLKEQLVQNIRQAQENYEKMKKFYEHKMAQMVEEVRKAQMDRDKLVEEIQQIEAKIQQGDHSGGGARLDKLSSDLKLKEEELSSLRKKQNEINRFMNQKKKNEMQLRVLTAEISNMKRQKVDLVKKMQDERKRYEDEARTRQKEILSLKRSQARDKQQIQRLGSQKDAQERVLKRKMEEITAAKLKLKHQQQLQAQAKRMNSALGRGKAAAPASNSSSSRAEKEGNWLSDEVKRRAEEQHKLEQLQREREAVAKEMEALYAQRERLEADLRRSIAPDSNIRDVLISPLKPPLNRRLSGRQEQQLTPEEEQLIYDLEERIESLHAQLEYKEEKISEISEDGRSSDAGAALPVKIERTQSLPEARSLLKMLFGMAVDVKKQDQRKEQEIAKLQVEMTDLAGLLEQERSRTQQIKLSYEESLHKVVQGGLDTSASPGRELSAPDDRSRILLSVSEERNTMLRKKCDELETIARHAEQEKQALQLKLARERREQSESQQRVSFLEAQLAKLSNQGDERSRFDSKEAPAPAATPGRASGPVSWANEFDDEEEDDNDDDDNDDDNMTGDDDDRAFDDDYDMKAGDDDGRRGGARDARQHPSLKDRREFHVELDDMGDNLDSISLSERRRREQLAGQAGEGFVHSGASKEDSPTQLGSDDSSSTTNSSIFVRLSNPSNFTGIHKNRVRESVSKRELLQSRSDRNRSRRQRDRGGATSVVRPPRSGTPTERSSSHAFGFKAPSKKTSQVMEVLANIKRENESEQFVTSPSLRPPQSYGLERFRDAPTSAADVADSSGAAASAAVPPPAPQVDVYSRLAGQYTASAQSKRQAATVARRPKTDDDGRSPSEKESMRRISSMDDVGGAQLEGGGDGDESSDQGYDPLLGGGSLLTQE
ncbi:hypothetical protein PybrP1_001825, partial [[Pythium] brassicae (nom. inval.)]